MPVSSSNMLPARVLEAVPNFSEGQDLAVVEAIVQAMRDAGAEILDWSADRDHHRSVVTLVGPPDVVENAAVAGARVAVERIDLGRHHGLHPRVGALDVLPFVPLLGLDMSDARASARRVGARLVNELGIPVYFYGEASDPPGRTLAALRRGGFEQLRDGWRDRPPDALPADWPHPGAHPTAGVTCVGARRVLLAWNVFIAGLDDEHLRTIARSLRAVNGGFAGLRALALRLPSTGRLQISMNLEDLDETRPFDVFLQVERMVKERGGAIEETEIIGMLPDHLVQQAAADRLRLQSGATSRVLSSRLLQVVNRAPGSSDG